MRLVLAVLLGKLICFLSRNFRIGGGSAAPGLYALKIYPDLVSDLSQQIPRNVVITGTNGKTTTARFLAHFAKEVGLKIIRNHTGSNLERGIASTLIQGVSLSHPRGGLNRHLGIWELDEAAFNTVAPKLKPDVVIFLNVFRDQLDRYGEIDSVIANWCQTLKTLSSETVVLVNGDDTNTLKLSGCFKGNVQKFGIKDYKIVGEGITHLKEAENLDFEAKNVKIRGLTGTSFSLSFHHQSSIIHLPVPGIYHIYDFLAGFAAGISLGFKPKQMVASLKSYSPAFGRVEKLDFGYVFSKEKGKLLRARSKIVHTEARVSAYIFLIKNPAGATQVFQTLAPNLKPHDRLLLALNDNIADGTDVSWIWDAQFETLFEPGYPQISAGVNTIPPQGWIYVICSGTRAHDLAVRLKYAGIDPKMITVEPDFKRALHEARKGLKGRLFILPTYTAMLELQSILVKSGLKKHYWEET